MFGNWSFVVFKKLTQLDNRLNITTRQGYQPGTSRNLYYQINRYLDFCLEFKFHPAPASQLQIRRFAQWIADNPTVQAFGTLSNYLSAVKTMHKIIGVPPPPQHHGAHGRTDAERT